MVEVAAVHTVEELRAALKALLSQKHLSLDAVVRKANGKVGKTTLSDIVRGKTSLPRWDTLEILLNACDVAGAELTAWERAYQQARVEGIGEPLDTVADPFALEVHRSITITTRGVLPLLPVYVPRALDDELGAVVHQAIEGSSGMMVLVGGSSTGKTRALWEALAPLRAVGGWRLWHPVSPTRGEALGQLDRVRPRTVLWLNETQKYLAGDGDRAATALRKLLTDQAPVLIVGTLWPVHHRELCRDPAAPSAKLLDATVIEVPVAFSGKALQAARRAATGDPRLAMAIEHAEDDQITQYLAGGLELVRRYRFSCSPAARAVVEVAMDMVRLGPRNRVPYGLLRDAAPHYLTGVDRSDLTDGWLERALAETSEPCKGVRGPVTRIDPFPALDDGGRRTRFRARSSDPADDVAPAFQLADYLDQYGRIHRADTIPPIGFWEAVADHAFPADLNGFGSRAMSQGLYRDAAQLWKNAIRHGHPRAPENLIDLLFPLSSQTEQPAVWIAEHVTIDNGYRPRDLLEELRKAGATRQVSKLAQRAITAVALDDGYGIARLLVVLWKVGATKQVSELAQRAITAGPLNEGRYVADLLRGLREIGATKQASELAQQAATEISLNNGSSVIWLLEELREMRATEPISKLAQRAATIATLDNVDNVASLLWVVHRARAAGRASEFAQRIVTEASLDDTEAVGVLLNVLWKMRASGQASELAWRGATEVSVDETADVGGLLRRLWEMAGPEQASELAQRAIAEAPFDHISNVIWLLRELWRVGAAEQASELAQGVAAVLLDDADILAHILEMPEQASVTEQSQRTRPSGRRRSPLNHHRNVIWLLRLLWEVGAAEEASELAQGVAAVLLDDADIVAHILEMPEQAGTTKLISEFVRQAATTAPLHNADDIIWLLKELWVTGAAEQAGELALRAATGFFLDHPSAVGSLLRELWKMGATKQAGELAQQATTAISLDDPWAVGSLLRELWGIGATEEARELAKRAAAGALIGRSFETGQLVEELLDIGAIEEASELIHRLPAGGLFLEFLRFSENPGAFRFGREPDGSPAAAWSWNDLE